MDDLIAFLRARLDEDEQAARWAIRESSFRERGLGEEWEAVRTGPEMRELVIQTKPKALRPHRVVGGLDPLLDESVAAHIVRHDPARLLREVEAKRFIISELWDDEEGFCTERTASDTAWAVLRCLALPYAAHPDYRPEWKP